MNPAPLFLVLLPFVQGAVIIGFSAALVCFYACKARVFLGLMMPWMLVECMVSVVSLGTILTGVFTDEDENLIGAPGGLNATIAQGRKTVGLQFLAALVVIGMSFVSALIFFLVT